MNGKKIPLYNPTIKDFTVTYDINGNGKPEPFTIRAGEIAYFDEIVAEHVKKHLIDRLVNERGSKPNMEIARQEYEKDVSVELWE